MSNEPNEQQELGPKKRNWIQGDDAQPLDPISNLAFRAVVVVFFSKVLLILIAICCGLMVTKLQADEVTFNFWNLSPIFGILISGLIQYYLVNSLGRVMFIASETARKVEELEKKMKQ